MTFLAWVRRACRSYDTSSFTVTDPSSLGLIFSVIRNRNILRPQSRTLDLCCACKIYEMDVVTFMR